MALWPHAKKNSERLREIKHVVWDGGSQGSRYQSYATILCDDQSYHIVSDLIRRMTKIGNVRAATNESQKTRNECETRNKTVFHTRLRHPETINSVPLNSVLRIKQIGV